MSDLRCPRCHSWIVWSCYGGVASRGYAGCGYAFGTRVLKRDSKAPNYFWEGQVERGLNGDVFVVDFEEQSRAWFEVRNRDMTIDILEAKDYHDELLAKDRGMPDDCTIDPPEWMAKEIDRLNERIAEMDKSWAYDAESVSELWNMIQKLEDEIGGLGAENKKHRDLLRFYDGVIR